MGVSLRGQRGISLLETVVALAILSLAGVGFLRALYTMSSDTDIYQQRVLGLVLAQSQTEEIKIMDYSAVGNYPVVITPSAGYVITVAVTQLETGKQQVKVTVSRNGEKTAELTTTKTDWR